MMTETGIGEMLEEVVEEEDQWCMYMIVDV